MEIFNFNLNFDVGIVDDDDKGLSAPYILHISFNIQYYPATKFVFLRFLSFICCEFLIIIKCYAECVCVYACVVCEYVRNWNHHHF